jgi:hypothetical protein
VAVTAAQLQSRILLEVGAGLEGSDELDLLTPSMAGIWDAWAWKGLSGIGFQYLYAKRQAIDVLLGQLRRKANFTNGPLTVAQNQWVTNLQKLRDNVTADLLRFEAQAAASRPPALAAILQTAPIMNDPTLGINQLDPNSRRYRGDPLLAPTNANTLDVPTGG